MSRFQEITERYKQRMRETEERHMARIYEIEAQRQRGVLTVVAICVFAVILIIVLIGVRLDG